MYKLCYFINFFNCTVLSIFLKKNCQKPKIARKFLALATVDAIDVSGL